MSIIEVTEPEKDRVYFWLREFNYSRNGDFMRSLELGETQTPLFLAARNSLGTIVGGLEGFLIHQWLRIGIMAVAPEHRQQGFGRDLVRRAEDIARDHGCFFSYIDTMSYQAPEFYASLGYLEVGRIENWDSHGHHKVFFTKNLRLNEA